MGVFDVFKEEFMKGLNQNLKGVTEEEKKKMGFWESMEANFIQGMKEGTQETTQEKVVVEEKVIESPETFPQQGKPGAENYHFGMQAFCGGNLESATEYFLASAAEGNSDAMFVLGDLSRKTFEADLASTGTIYYSSRLHDLAPLLMAIKLYVAAGYFHANEEEVVSRITVLSKYFQDTDQFTSFVQEQMECVESAMQNGNPFQKFQR